MKDKDLIKIINHFGAEKQRLKAVEELAELQEVLIKDINKGGFAPYILEEVADVWIMINQIKLMYGFTDAQINEIAEDKIERTFSLMERDAK
jgi:predicted house-cleaning noncanonical NTP pyrophosphatase (MazG superfamily)